MSHDIEESKLTFYGLNVLLLMTSVSHAITLSVYYTLKRVVERMKVRIEDVLL